MVSISKSLTGKLWLSPLTLSLGYGECTMVDLYKTLKRPSIDIKTSLINFEPRSEIQNSVPVQVRKHGVKISSV